MALHKRKLFSLIATLALTLSAMAVPIMASFADNIYIPWVWHNIGIYVRADGSVDPSGSPIQRNGNVYLLTADVYASIAVQRNDSVFNGNGYKMYGSTYGTALLLQNANNVVVKNLDAEYYSQGVYFDNCNNSIVKDSKIIGAGITMIQSSGNQLISNNFRGEISMDYSSNNTVTDNNATSISVAWSRNITIKGNQFADDTFVTAQLALGNYTEGIYIDNSDNITINNNLIARKNIGVDLWQSINLTLEGNRLERNQVGFKLFGTDLQHYPESLDGTNTVNGRPVYYLVNVTNYQVPANAGWVFAFNSRNITVQNLIAQPNWDSVAFIDTSDSSIANCTLTGNYNAIHFVNVTNTVVTQNSINGNSYAAMNFEAALNNTVTSNEISNNNCILNLWRGTTNNVFLQNDFVGAQVGHFDNGTRNQWNNDGAGNFWSSFIGVDLNHDGVSDSSYLIDVESGETDHFPAMKPLNSQAVTPPQEADQGFLAMPEEYINYTLANVDGALWARIDGVYPMHVLAQNLSYLPMLYPVPPNTTNIHVYLQGVELNWTNYASTGGDGWHHTDIGDWKMISCTLTPLPSDFVLSIHYEHPVQVINGSYTFLYDLNISPYLSPSSVVSIAHFGVLWPNGLPTMNVYRTSINGTTWQLFNETLLQTDPTPSISFDVISQYNKPLLGDIAFVLKNSPIPELFVWVILPLLACATAAAALFLRKRKPTGLSGVLLTANVKYRTLRNKLK